jgi:hypothetical protein
MADMFNPYEQQIIGLKEQKALAQKLREQAMEPTQGQMVSGWYVPPSWTQMLAKGFNAYIANKKEKQAEQGIKDVMKQREQDIAGVLHDFPQERVIQPENAPESGMGPVLPAVTRKPSTNELMAWTLRAGQIDPSLGHYGQLAMQMSEQAKSREENRQARADEMEARFAEGRATLKEKQEFEARLARERAQDRADAAERDRAFREEAANRDRELRKDLQKSQAQSQKENIRLTAQLRQPPQEKLVSVMGPDNKAVLVPQSQAAGLTPFNAQTVKAATEPGASKAGAINALNTVGFDPKTGKDQVTDLIKQSTGSGFGRATDIVAGLFGKSTAGAEAVGQLEAISKQITLDRLNGKLGAGISNADVMMLDKALGDISNPNKPVDVKLKSWEQAKRILMNTAGYEMPDSQSAPAAGPRRDVVPNPMNAPANQGGFSIRPKGQ